MWGLARVVGSVVAIHKLPLWGEFSFSAAFSPTFPYPLFLRLQIVFPSPLICFAFTFLISPFFLFGLSPVGILGVGARLWGSNTGDVYEPITKMQ